ncbi:hypothetical protein [Sporosarcina trichiuri]|uniref:hypothetical protein n=1 Tax=Sporosarcina trichiuri TaxID=3056445 RepID=UPI0025B433E7|nr:hypothetical protein [Sporosarcina sp. 0.2-SM1T-5]WJY26444.1 hypothetical protein QWT68_10165 [Sporosarcina sp. 0.2-SM1T-5]
MIVITLLLLVMSSSASAETGKHPLQDWYDGEFKPRSERLGAVTADGLFQVFRMTRKISQQSENLFSLAMLEFSDTNTKETVLGIKDYRRKIENEIATAKNQLEQEDFEAYKEQLAIERTVAAEVDAVLGDVLSQD